LANSTCPLMRNMPRAQPFLGFTELSLTEHVA
jgi:hypothetical protein